MSHKVNISAVEREKYGVPTVRHLGALRAACEAAGHTLEWVENYRMGDDRKTGRPVKVTGWAVEFKTTGSDSRWVKKVVYGKLSETCKPGEMFELTDEDVDEHFDNYPMYSEDHAEVVAGRKRVGEGGRWGDIKYLWGLHDGYKKAAYAAITASQQAVAKKMGWSCQVESQTEKQTVLLVDDGVASRGVAGNPLDQAAELK